MPNTFHHLSKLHRPVTKLHLKPEPYDCPCRSQAKTAKQLAQGDQRVVVLWAELLPAACPKSTPEMMGTRSKPLSSSVTSTNCGVEQGV